jgi:hypothetical protein
VTTDPLPELDAVLVERVESHMSLQEAIWDVREAVADDPDAEAAFREMMVALQRWLDCWSKPAADVPPAP